MDPRREAFSKVFAKYVPESAISWCVDLIFEHAIQLKITRARQSKLGDYRHPYGGKGHRITINHDLNPYHFLVVYAHEIAHLICWNQFKNRVAPHGKEWQTIFSHLLKQLIHLNCFPPEISSYLNKRGFQQAASSCADPELLELLRKYNKSSDIITLNEIPHNSLFIIRNGRVFKKGPAQRTRYKCLEITTNQAYLIHGSAEVKPYESKL